MDIFSQRFILTGGGNEARLVQESVLREIEQREYDATSCFAIRLAMEEALSNAINHGNKGAPDKTVKLEATIDRDRVQIEIEDEGEGFDPTAVPDPTEEENLEIPCGRGIVLMKSFMTEVSFNDAGNRVIMRYERPGARDS